MAKPYRMAEIDVLVRRAWEKRRLARENVQDGGKVRHLQKSYKAEQSARLVALGSNDDR